MRINTNFNKEGEWILLTWKLEVEWGWPTIPSDPWLKQGPEMTHSKVPEGQRGRLLENENFVSEEKSSSLSQASRWKKTTRNQIPPWRSGKVEWPESVLQGSGDPPKLNVFRGRRGPQKERLLAKNTRFWRQRPIVGRRTPREEKLPRENPTGNDPFKRNHFRKEIR